MAKISWTEIDNKVDDLVERLVTAQSAIQFNIRGCLSHATGLVDSAAALQVNIRAEIRRTAATIADHELESLMIAYSKLLCAKLELVEVISDHA